MTQPLQPIQPVQPVQPKTEIKIPDGAPNDTGIFDPGPYGNGGSGGMYDPVAFRKEGYLKEINPFPANNGNNVIEDYSFEYVTHVAAGGIFASSSRLTTAFHRDYHGTKLYGLGGNDTIRGFGGNDILDGGDGDDFLDGGYQDDTLWGGDGKDYLIGGDGNDDMHGGKGDDYLAGGFDNDTLVGDEGADYMAGGYGDDVYVVDNEGDYVQEPDNLGDIFDKVYTTLGSYDLAAPGKGWGIDHLQYTGDSTFFGYGNELHNVIVGARFTDTLAGRDGDDHLIGNEGRDALYGQADNDTLDGGTDADWMYGGTGNDVYIVENAGDRVYEDVAAWGGEDKIYTTLNSFDMRASDKGAGVENLQFVGNGNFVGQGNTLKNAVVGAGGGDRLYGHGGDDRLYGGAGRDYLFGGDQNDLLDGEADADLLYGGAGNDTYYVDNSGDVVNETEYVAGGGTGIARVNSGYRDVGSESDTVITTLSSYDLSNIGSNGSVARAFFPETLYGIIENLTYAGADRFTGIGNDANNVITGGALSDNLYGGRGHDTVVGGAGNDGIDLGEGDDKAFIDNGTAEGGDVVVGGGGFDSVYADDSTIAGGLRLNVFRAGTGYTPDVNRVAFTSAAIDVDFIWGNAGSDVIDASRLDQRIDIAGMNGADTIIGGAAGDNLYGGDDADTITGGVGGDGMDGGRGSDTFVMDNGTEIGGDVAVGGEGYDVVEADASVAATGLRLVLFPTGTPFTPEVNLVRLTSAAMEVESVHGGTGNDWVDASRLGTDASIAFRGNEGNDTFISGSGSYDRFDGGADTDTIVYSDLASNYEIRHALPSDGWLDPSVIVIEDRTTGLIDVVGDVEIVQFGDGTSVKIADALLAAEPVESIVGSDDADTLYGTDGVDRIEGLGGADLLVGQKAADYLDGGADVDTVSYAASAAGVTVDLATGTGHGGDAEGDTFIGIEHAVGSAFDDTFQGGADRGQFVAGDGNDTMTGGSAFDWLEGGNGNDTFTGTGGFMVMFGGDGDDRMTGSLDTGNYFDAGAGNDVMIGGNTTDYMADVTGGDDIMHGGGGDDTVVDLYGATQLYGEDGNDFVTSAGGSGLLDGGAGNDYLTVANGNYTLIGGAGDDTFEFAGSGSASYTGGAGADVFTYRVGGGSMTVTDFQDGIDHIYLWDNHYYGNVPLESLTIADSAAGAVISWNGSSEMVLTGIHASQLTENDFLF